jgi:hypothetical protein
MMVRVTTMMDWLNMIKILMVSIHGDGMEQVHNENVEENDDLDPGVQPEMIIEDIQLDDVKVTRSGKAYSMKLVGKSAQSALAGKQCGRSGYCTKKRPWSRL